MRLRTVDKVYVHRYSIPLPLLPSTPHFRIEIEPVDTLLWCLFIVLFATIAIILCLRRGAPTRKVILNEVQV